MKIAANEHIQSFDYYQLLISENFPIVFLYGDFYLTTDVQFYYTHCN